ncbi:MAG TPA: hypothetical protein VF186_06325 [Gaiellaceae bacterium]
MTERIGVHVVPHTHWDREWYLPFQRFRLRLVDVVDEVLDLLERSPEYRFTLDGQLATVDDYLEIRPEGEERIRRLAAEGRLALGPWQILMDEFLVSGETIVRNLEAGLARAAEFGDVLEVGYLPDMFGHVAQMPQILSRAGIRHAVVYRGVPAAVDRHVFRWEAPDGSAVRAEYLVGGYGNAAYLADDPERVEEELERFGAAVEPFFDGGDRLAMVGTDHMPPSPDLPALIARANARQERFRLRLSTLGEYLAGAPEPDGLVQRGELRSAARANMLMGVVSARIDLKQACARAERALARGAEPLLALHGDAWPEAFLREAWSRVIANSAHDSICGCSADDVCTQVLVRYAEAEQLAEGLAERTAAQVAAAVPRGALAVYNPSPLARSGLVEVELPVADGVGAVALELPDGTRVATQELARGEAELYATELPGERLAELLNRLHGRELFGRQVNGFAVDADAGTVVFEVEEEASDAPFDGGALERALADAAAAAPDRTFRMRIVTTPPRRLVARVPAPGLGWTSARAVAGPVEVAEPVEAGPRTLDNGLVRVEVAADGTFDVTGGGAALRGVGRLVDGGDAGDSYNWAPPARDTLVDAPGAVAVEVRQAGPLVAELAVRRGYRWPAGLTEDAKARSDETVPVEVETLIELRAGEPFVRLRVAFDNPSADHRLRLHVPLARRAESTFAEGQFAVVERRGAPEAGHGEVPLATYPASGFVDAGGAALLLEHVCEYELVEDGAELALTVLRSTGLISRSDNAYREDPAGPQIAIPAAQCRGPWSLSFALLPHAGGWSAAGVPGELETYLHPFRVARGGGPAGALPPELPGLELEGRGVVLSALRRRGEQLELRVVCEHDEPCTATVRVGADEHRLELGPWEIRTVLLGR